MSDDDGAHYSALEDSEKKRKRNNGRCGGLSCRNIGGIVAVCIALLCTIIGLSVDEMTAYLNKDDHDKIWKYCGWQEWRCVDSYSTCLSKSDTLKYESKCSSCDSTCEETYGYKEHQYCRTEGSGELWLMCSLFAMIFLLISIIMDILKIKFALWDTHGCDGHYNLISGMIRVLAGILYIIAVGGWIFENPVCWDSELLDDRRVDLGQSPYWILAACIMSVFSCPLAIN